VYDTMEKIISLLFRNIALKTIRYRVMLVMMRLPHNITEITQRGADLEPTEGRYRA
jgi:hypothetical protein